MVIAKFWLHLLRNNRNLMNIKIALCLVCMLPGAVFASESNLKQFIALLTQYDNFKAGFVQSTVSSDDSTLESVEGEVLIKRPNQFVWLSYPPVEQEIVSNGKTLWIYDRDLDQVTIQPAKSKIQDSPAVILSGDEQQIKRLYDVSLNSDGVYVLTPVKENSGLSSIQVSFKEKVVNALLFEDSLGQKTIIELFDTKTNVALDGHEFDFVPPDGVDVLEQAE
ncbi:outer membrane lipoprotein chaperone LolA [Gynuella sp.]|uniref:outer membrane lipoprotein chaperone LolA n=1 Tax=Gynuella sp. TaxID=2969146 RepID=UPI003D0F6789